MPAKFGSIKRVSATRDNNDLKRNINLFVVSQDQEGFLQKCSTTLKENLKNWLNSARMVSDTIDIFDTNILNFGITFDVSLTQRASRQSALSQIRNELYTEMNRVVPSIGQSFSIREVERVLNGMIMVNGVNSVKVKILNGEGYSAARHNVPANVSPDGGMIYIPENCIWEIKNVEDITGRIQ